MARIRSIKPGFWDDEKLPRISLQANLIFIGIWNFCDDSGVIQRNHSWIKSKLFPARDDIRNNDVKIWIDELVQARMLVPFDYENEGYYVVRTWKIHQKIDKPQPSKIPEALISEVRSNSENVTRTIAEESPLDRIGREEERKGNDRIEELMPAGISHLKKDFENEPLTEVVEKKKEKVSAQKEKGLYAKFMDDYNSFYTLRTGFPAKIDGKQGSAAKSIIAYLQKISNEKTDDGVLISWRWILNKWDKLEPYHRNKMTLSQISSELMNIINQIKNGTGKNDQGGNGKKSLGSTQVTSEGKHPGKL